MTKTDSWCKSDSFKISIGGNYEEETLITYKIDEK